MVVALLRWLGCRLSVIVLFERNVEMLRSRHVPSISSHHPSGGQEARSHARLVGYAREVSSEQRVIDIPVAGQLSMSSLCNAGIKCVMAP